MKHTPPQPRSLRELVLEFEAEERLPQGELLEFEGVDGKDVYNITAPFEVEGRSCIAGRVEAREHWANSETVVFEKKGSNVWGPASGAPRFRMEDPFVARVGNELVFGGVEVYPDPSAQDSDGIGYKTVFYRGKTLLDLKRFAVGPSQMKDIRLVELKYGKIGIFTRPQGKIGGRGRIGFTTVDTLEDVTTENIKKAPLIENLLVDDKNEWCGVNEARLLEDGTIGVLGHSAYKDAAENTHYYSMVFQFNPETFEHTAVKVIAERKNFPAGPAKRPQLGDVVFPGGTTWNSDDTCTLYGGLNDVRAGRIIIRNPFSK